MSNNQTKFKISTSALISIFEILDLKASLFVDNEHRKSSTSHRHKMCAPTRVVKNFLASPKKESKL